jgi:CPA2 family monovalent cation:H+ antiporter-2
MHGVAALLAAAAVAYTVARLLRLPAVPLLLAAGLGISLVTELTAETVESALIVGVSVLLFVVGLELDPRRIRAQQGAAVRVGIWQFVVLALLGFVAARALGLGPTEAGYVALALPVSSTLVGVRLLQRRTQLFEPFGRLVLGVLLLQDVLVLLAIPFVTELTAGWRSVGVATGAVALIGGLSLAVRRWGAPLLLAVAEEGELVLLGSLAILFVFLAASSALGLPVVVGAFLAGAALSRFPVNGIVRGELAPIGDFFAAIFFTALGALVRVPTPHELWQAAVLTLLVLVVTPPLVAFVAERAGFTSKPALEAGLLLSQTSEISLVVGLAGVIQGHIGESLFVVLTLVTLTTMLLTPFLATDEVARRLARMRPGRRRVTADTPADHVLLLGAGATGMPLLEDLILSGCRVVVVDDDPAVIARLEEAGVSAVRGDASDPRVLREAGAGRARVVSSTIRRPRDNAALLAMARGVQILVRVFDEADAGWVKERGGEPILYSAATADGLMEWYDERAEELDRDAVARSAGSPSQTSPNTG